MRTLSLSVLAASCLLPMTTCAQANGGTSSTGASASNIGQYAIVSRAPNSRVWQMPTLQTNEIGIVSTNYQSYTEVRSGLCHMENGVLVDSANEIDIVADGAQAVHGQHQPHWAANANTPGGAVTLTTVGGQVLQSTVWGVCYWDVSTGTNILLGGIQNSQGIQTGNQVIFENAFGGNVINADIDYSYTVEGLEQNIVFRQQLPDPAATYGLNEDQTYVQIWTEFFNPPQPVAMSTVADGVTNDQFLNFGDMSIGIGQAFLATNEGGMISAGPVEKEWAAVEGKQFLIEEIPFSEIASLQQALPEHASISKPSRKTTHTAMLEKPPISKPKDFGSVKYAANYPVRPGLTVDYYLVNNATNMTFRGDSTYYVSGTVSIYGTNTFEGGTVIKFTNNNSASIFQSASLNPILNFATGQFRPVVFTAKDDNSAGTAIAGSTGNPYTKFYANPALNFGCAASITNARFLYAYQALTVASSSAVSLTDLQIINGYKGLNDTGTGLVTVRNALFANDHVAINSIGPSASMEFENATLAGNSASNNFAVSYAYPTGDNISFTNSVFSYMTYLTNQPPALVGYDNGFYSTSTFGGDATTATGYPFQTVGAGGYYFASTSPFFQLQASPFGDAALTSDLAGKTVYPPLTLSGWETNYLTLYPQAQRDTNSNPSLGFHYAPIDYACNIALSNVTLNVLPGTAIAGCGSQYGIAPYINSAVNFQGTATAPINFLRYNAAQEQSNTNWESSSWQGTFVMGGFNITPASLAFFQFTDWAVLASDAHVYSYYPSAVAQLAFQNCQFYNGQFEQNDPVLAVTNCLFRRGAVYIQEPVLTANRRFIYNNLFHAGAVGHHVASGISSGAWTFSDNLFDTTNLVYSTSNLLASQDSCNYNGYIITNTLTNPKLISPGDVILTNSPAYQISFLGSYYYPTNQTNLIYQGSRLASAAGLYHYTVTANQAIEGTNQVSIGFHYVATDGNGNPLDSNGDGVPDYIEGANGNGNVDPGEVPLAGTQPTALQ